MTDADPNGPAAPSSCPDETAFASNAVPPPVAQPEWVCWRCGGAVPGERTTCERCAADRPGLLDVLRPQKAAVQAHPVIRMLTAYGGLLAVSVCFALVGMALSQASPSASRGSQEPQRLYEVTLPDVIIEVTWTVAIIIAVCTVPRPQYHAGGSSQARLAAWLTAGPVLAASLIGNVWYHDLLRRYVDFPRMFEAESVAPPYAWELVFAVVSISIQPGIFEELFFRHVALGTLRSVMGSGAAIAVSAAMFGVAHLHSPISIPYLIIVGLVLGLFRVWSGSLLLPILMHATHNGVVLWMELQSLITR